MIEEYMVATMGHGAPIDPQGVDGLGKEGRYKLDVGNSSKQRLAEFWGLTKTGMVADTASGT